MSILTSVLALVFVFLFAIEKFSNQIKKLSGSKIKESLQKATSSPIKGLTLGAIFTSLIQSSTATTVILVTLADASLITFRNALAVVFGANIGTTITSQLIALNIAVVAPYLVILGFLLIYFGSNYKYLGKPIFYFGLIFFSLSLVAVYLEPLKDSAWLLAILTHTKNPFLGVVVGAIFTALIQSSSLTSALVLVLSTGGSIGLSQAFGIILGANIGTTVTALIASIGGNNNAKKIAIAHLSFNVIGVVLILPFISQFIIAITWLGGNLQQQIANAHLLFNLGAGLLATLLISPFYSGIEYLSGLFMKKPA